MRAALVHPFSFPDVRRGGERYVDDLSWWLAQRGHHVDVITGVDGAQSVHTDSRGVTQRRVRHLERARLARRGVGKVQTFGVAALPALVGHRYEIVHAMVPSAALAARLAGQRVVYTLLGHPTPDQLVGRPFDRALTRAAVRGAHCVAALSEASATSAEAFFGRRPEVLSPGVRLESFPPDLGVRAGPPRLLFPADLSVERKGVHHLLAALPAVLARHPDARVQLAGPGDHRWALERLGAAGHAVSEALDHLGVGVLDEVPERYRRATVTVLPSWHEAFGLVLVESLASGTPVVCTDSGGMAEIVGPDGAVGRVAAHGDVAGLAAAILDVIELARQPATPARCVERARRWSWEERIGCVHEALYRRMAR